MEIRYDPMIRTPEVVAVITTSPSRTRKSVVLPVREAEVDAVCGEAERRCPPSYLCHGKPYSLPALPGEYAGPCQYGAL